MHLNDDIGLNSEEAKAFFKRRGINTHIRAQGPDTKIMDRQSAITRAGLHFAETQLSKEGITATFKVLLQEQLFAENSMMTVGNRTAYQAVFGRQPPMLSAIAEDPTLAMRVMGPGTAWRAERSSAYDLRL